MHPCIIGYEITPIPDILNKSNIAYTIKKYVEFVFLKKYWEQLVHHS